MSEVWCVSEIVADEEDPFVQHMTVTAYTDAGEAEMWLGANDMRKFQETRNGLVCGIARVSRYCRDIPELADSDDAEIVRISRVLSSASSGSMSNGLIVTRSIHVPEMLRGMRISRKILQEVRQIHNGMKFHYAHSAVPQEMSSLSCEFPRRFEALRQIYLAAGIGLEVPDKADHPEIMTAYWNGVPIKVEDCRINWSVIQTRLNHPYAQAA